MLEEGKVCVAGWKFIKSFLTRRGRRTRHDPVIRRVDEAIHFLAPVPETRPTTRKKVSMLKLVIKAVGKDRRHGGMEAGI